jgi:hypothetical protein
MGTSGRCVKMRRLSQNRETHLVNETRVMIEFAFCRNRRRLSLTITAAVELI